MIEVTHMMAARSSMQWRSQTGRERDFCAWLRQLRTEHDLTQEALAEIVGCSAQTVRSFESGRRRPSREMAARLAEVLGLPAEERDTLVRLARAPLAPQPPSSPLSAPQGGAHASAQLLPRSLIPLPPDALIGRSADLQRLRQALLADSR